MAVMETMMLPEHFEPEPEVREQLSNRVGHQRCIEGASEVLLVVHEVPEPGVAACQALFFWRCHEDRWFQATGAGLEGLVDLLDRYEAVIGRHEEALGDAGSVAAIVAVARHANALAGATRELAQVLEQALGLDPDDRTIRACRDHGREIQRAAAWLATDARLALDHWHVQLDAQQVQWLARLHRLGCYLLASWGLLLVAGAVALTADGGVGPQWVMPLAWLSLLGAMVFGALWLRQWWVRRSG